MPRMRPEADGDGLRLCVRCEERKPPEDFYRKATGRLLSYCKPCSKARSHAWMKEHPHMKKEQNSRFNHRSTSQKLVQNLCVSVSTAASILSISRFSVYELLERKVLTRIDVPPHILLLHSEIDAYSQAKPGRPRKEEK